MKKIKNFMDAWGEFYGSTSIGERGQVVIPKKLRISLDLKKGDKFVVMEKAGAIMLLPTDLMKSFITDITSQLKKL